MTARISFILRWTSNVGKLWKEDDDILPVATLSISVSPSYFCTSFFSSLPRLHLVAASFFYRYIGPQICRWSRIVAASGKSASTQHSCLQLKKTHFSLFGLGNHLRCDNLLSVAFHVLAYEFQVPIPSANIFKEQDLNSVR
jgi:hypothetical protein